jgi:hypothetical protein
VFTSPEDAGKHHEDDKGCESHGQNDDEDRAMSVCSIDMDTIPTGW